MANKISALWKPPLGSQLDQSDTLSRDAYACWLFNEGGGTTASSIINKTKTLATFTTPAGNAAKWQTREQGMSINMDATGGYLAIPNIVAPTNMTISCWLRHNGTNDSAVLGAPIGSGYNYAFLYAFNKHICRRWHRGTSVLGLYRVLFY